ncbi:hypothetical protein MVEN_01064500 [Mycena venus]|uniref:Uncharacterized protein n=1 Tax=Mycena venus TaxID=2733690 RepID=A0A8H6Y425_9AGAR|nr:hypothetical protein MVEN_01064500 [Mycena venus]
MEIIIKKSLGFPSRPTSFVPPSRLRPLAGLARPRARPFPSLPPSLGRSPPFPVQFSSPFADPALLSSRQLAPESTTFFCLSFFGSQRKTVIKFKQPL